MRKNTLYLMGLVVVGPLGTILLSGCPCLGCSVDVEGARDVLEINGKHYVLKCLLARDFFPPEHSFFGTPLTSSVWLVESDGLNVDPGINLTYLWVVQGIREWATEFSDTEAPEQSPDRILRYASDDPRWATGPRHKVDVVVRVVDNEGQEYLLRYLDAEIECIQ